MRWTGRHEKAALLVAQDELTNDQIANSVGIGKRTLDKWKLKEDFLARVGQIVERIREEVLKVGIADRVERMKRLDSDWKRMQQIRNERIRYWTEGLAKAKHTLAMYDIEKQDPHYKEAEELIKAWRLEGNREKDAMSPEVKKAFAAIEKPKEVYQAERFIDVYMRTPGIETGTITRDIKSNQDVMVLDTSLLSELREMEMQAAKELGQLKDPVVNVNVKAYAGFDPEEV